MATLAGDGQTLLVKKQANRGNRRIIRPAGMDTLKTRSYLAGSSFWETFFDRKDRIFYLRRYLMRMIDRRSAAVIQISDAALSIAIKPLVAGLATDIVIAAQLAHAVSAFQ